MTPPIGQLAPDFTCQALVNGKFETVSPSNLKGQYVLLFFYPLDFTFVCPTEIVAFSDRADEFRKLKCEVIGASCDSVYSHLAWTKQSRQDGGLGPIKIPLLADTTGKVARAYGIYNEESGVPYRGLFIIDPKQVLRQVIVNDLPIGRSVDEALRLVQAIQHFEEHGEVCPIGWKKGAQTMKPDPEGSKDYFKKQG